MSAAKDFFISFTRADLRWAEWIAGTLEQAGYAVIFQPWDFPPGSVFPEEIHQALVECRQTIAVFSSRYLNSPWCRREAWSTLTGDVDGRQRRLIPVRIEPCRDAGLFAGLTYLDLTGLGREQARQTLLAGLTSARREPPPDQPYPGDLETLLYPGRMPDHWKLPPRNPFFTGREQQLARLQPSLATSGVTVSGQVVAGLGGIGKTQVALEYAYRNLAVCNLVWWIHAEAESEIIDAYRQLLSRLLGKTLPPDQRPEEITGQVKSLLGHLDKWLLIFDNATAEAELRDYLPTAGNGQVIITTRSNIWSGQKGKINLEVFTPQEARAFLLDKTGREDAEGAGTVAAALGCLPLALEQAAAYIAVRQIPFAGYLRQFTEQHRRLWERERSPADYPATVATTWKLAIAEVDPAGRQILQVCAFLAPEKIERTLLQEIGEGLSLESLQDEFLLGDGLESLQRYSLVRVTEEALSVHQLVQQVVRDALPEEEAASYSRRLLGFFAGAFPGDIWENPACWGRCQALLVHSLLVIEQAGSSEEKNMVGNLLSRTGMFHHRMGLYDLAEPLYCRALKLRQALTDPDHPEVAAALNNLAALHKDQGRYQQAEPLHRRALAIREKQLGPEHPDVATSLNNLALLLQDQGKYEQAEPLHRRALAIREKRLGPDHPDVAMSLNNLALVLQDQGKYEQAEPLLRRALHIWEHRFEHDHPDVAQALNNLAHLFHTQGKYDRAEPLYRRALGIKEKLLGPDHPDVALSLNNLAMLLQHRGEYAQAEPLYRRALEIREKLLGPEHPDVALSLNNLAMLLQHRGEYAQAEPLYRRALEIREKQFGPDHPSVAICLNNQASMLQDQGEYEQAEQLYRRALGIREKRLDPDHPDLALSLNNLALLLQLRGRYEQAEPLFCRALEILEQKFGRHHPHYGVCLANLNTLRGQMNKPE